MADIYAVDSIYGAATTRTGDTVYGFHDTAGSIFNFASYTQAPALTIYDSGGNDTLDCSGYSVAQTIDLHPGSFSSVGGLVNNIGIATNTIIENAIGGSGNDTLIANDAGDTLKGGGGADVLTGGAGNDILIGGSGNDVIDGGAGLDQAIFTGLRSAYTIGQLQGGGYSVTGPDGSDTVFNVETFVFDDQSVAIAANHAPVVTASNQTVGANSLTAVSGWFSVTDADGDAITKYVFYDDTSDASGYFVLAGVAQPVKQSITVLPTQLGSLYFHSGTVSDHLYVAAWDSLQPGQTDLTVSVSTPAATLNHAPVVTASNQTVTAGSIIAASSLFAASDPDGDPITKYVFYDDTSGSGYFVLNGVAQSAKQSITVLPGQLSSLSFHAGNGSDHLYAAAWDNQAPGQTDFTVTGTAAAANHPPVVTASDQTVAAGSTIAVSSLFAASDPDGDQITKYVFYDDTADASSGYFVLNGMAQASKQSITVLPSQLSNLSFHAGTTSDHLYAAAWDNQSPGQTDFTVSVAAPPPNHAPVVTAANQTVAANSNIAGNSLFSATDPDGDAITKYVFYDDTADASSGYFVLNGVVQAAKQSITVLPSQLSNLSFHAGTTSDHLYAAAWDNQSPGQSDFTISVTAQQVLPHHQDWLV